ncbi:MAG: hypothetical protein Q7J24_06335 [Desulfomicrobium sp.]|nr:hypothetical protein [Desulfomicrobium sp.]
MNDAILKIRCSTGTAKKMKVLAAELGCSLGELLRTITFMVKVKQLTHGQLAQAHMAASAVPEAGWIGDDLPAHRDYLSRVACLAREVGDLSTAASFERKCAHIGMTPATIETLEATSDPNETLQVEA